MVPDARYARCVSIVRFLTEHVTRVANNFSFTNMFFVKNCSLLLRDISDNPQAPANESIRSENTWQLSHTDWAMLFETEESVHFRGHDPVSAYPLVHLAYNVILTLANPLSSIVITNDLEKLPESSKTLERLLDSLARVGTLFTASEIYPVSIPDFIKYQIIMQVEIYDLTSSDRVKRGVKRAWLIGETLALKTKYNGVRYRPDRSLTKPWTAEVKPPMEKNKVWIADCNTPEGAALAYDVAAFYYGKGNKALNFEHTPRFLPKTLEYPCEKEKKHAIQEQARQLRRNPLSYLIHQLPYGILFLCVVCEFTATNTMYELAFLVVELMRLVRNDDVATISMDIDLSHLRNAHVPTNIPQLLESIDRIVKKTPPRQRLYWAFCLSWEFLLPCSAPYSPLMAQYQTKDNFLTHIFIEWVRNNLVTPQTTSMEAKHLPASPPQCNVLSIRSVEIDLRAPQTSSMAMEAEDPLVNIPPQCNTLSMHYPHEQIQDTLEQDLIISHKFSLESQHSTYQDATPQEQVVQFSIGEQAATIVLSTPVAAIVETPLLPSPPLDVEIPNEGFQTGDLYEDIQEGSMSGQMTSTLGTLSNFHPLPFSCFSPLSTGAQTQSSTFMDSDVGKDLMVPIPSSMEVGDYHPKCNNLVVPLPPSHDYTQDALKQDLRNLDKLPLQCGHLAFQVTSPEEDECIKSPTVDQAVTEFMDLDDGEDLATLLKRPQHDQLGDIGDQVASVEATLMEGYHPDINDMVKFCNFWFHQVSVLFQLEPKLKVQLLWIRMLEKTS
ncbi:hypothetical protein CY35_14G012500 [Sphagnum magellanicum]|nr:hypothetical protein CY35_14G012500 [Sphagnum magellanicum]